MKYNMDINFQKMMDITRYKLYVAGDVSGILGSIG